MKHFEKAGMKPDLNAHSNCCQNPAAWQEWSTKSAQSIQQWWTRALVSSLVDKSSAAACSSLAPALLFSAAPEHFIWLILSRV